MLLHGMVGRVDDSFWKSWGGVDMYSRFEGIARLESWCWRFVR